MDATENKERVKKLQASEEKVSAITSMPEPFRRLIDQHYRNNYTSTMGKTARLLNSHHDAEEAIQNTYLRACEYWYSIKDFDPWFYRSLANCCRDVIRDRMRHGAVLTPLEDVEHELGVEPMGEDYERLKDALGQIGDQPPHKKKILVAYFFNRQTQPEIAKELGVSIKTVEHTVARFRHTLR